MDTRKPGRSNDATLCQVHNKKLSTMQSTALTSSAAGTHSAGSGDRASTPTMRVGLRKAPDGASKGVPTSPPQPSSFLQSLSGRSQESNDSLNGIVRLFSSAEHKAAVLIQTRYRGLKARTKFQERNAAALEAAVKLQRAVRTPTTRSTRQSPHRVPILT